MRESRLTTRFEKDYKREGKSPKHRDLDFKLEQVIEMLCTDQVLPRRNRDHLLLGKYANIRECHVKPDLLLLYYKSGNDLLYLVRLGSHSELFS